MKYVIPLAAILVMGIAVGVHPAFVGPAGPDRRPPMVPEVRLQSHGSDRIVPATETAAALSEVAERVGPVAAIPAAKKAGDAPWRKVYVPLAQEIALSGIQRSALEQILKDRDDEIRRYHDQLRASGALDLRQFEWQTTLMKDGWFRKIDAQLDRSQHEQFVVLVHQGLLNVGLDFTIEPGMTVID